MAPTIRTVDLVKSWLGQTLRATGAAVVIPAAIIAAIALTAFGGAGLGGLGSLSQIVAGPQAVVNTAAPSLHEWSPPRCEPT